MELSVLHERLSALSPSECLRVTPQESREITECVINRDKPVFATWVVEPIGNAKIGDLDYANVNCDNYRVCAVGLVETGNVASIVVEEVK